jgi:hypothetical protein
MLTALNKNMMCPPITGRAHRDYEKQATWAASLLVEIPTRRSYVLNQELLCSGVVAV